MEPTIFWVHSRGQGHAYYQCVDALILMGVWCTTVNSNRCALAIKMKTRALKQQSALTPSASQCNKGNHVVTGEVFLLDIGLLMGVTTLPCHCERSRCSGRVRQSPCFQVIMGLLQSLHSFAMTLRLFSEGWARDRSGGCLCYT